MKKNNGNILHTPVATLFFGALRRSLWMPIAYSILSIVIISFTSNRLRYVSAVNGDSYIEWLLTRLNNQIAIFGISIIVAALVGCTLFSYINRVSSACFVHGLPVSRGEIFAAHYCAGAAMLLIPALISSVYVGFHTGHSLFGLLFFVTDALYSIGVMSFAILVCQITANTLGGLIFTGFGLATPVICEGFIIYLMETNLYGYAGNYSNLTVSRYCYLIPELVPTAYGLIYVAATVVFTVVGLILFKRRAVELSGDLIAFSGIRKAAVYVCGILAGMCAYLIFGASLFMFLLFGILCAVLVNFAVRKRFTVRGAITPSLIVVATTIAIFAIFRFDLTGFERRIPSLDDVESARVYTRFYDYSTESVNGKQINYVDFHEPITDRAGVEAVRVLHEDLLGNKNFYSTSDRSRSYTVEYNLKNGKSLVREYSIYYERNASALEAVSSLREFKRHNHELLEGDITITTVDIEGVYGNSVRFEGARAARLYEAVVKDLMSVPYELDHDLHVFESDRYINLSFEYFLNNAVYTNGEKVETSVLAQLLRTENERIYPSYVNTLAVISEIAPELIDIDAEIPDNSSVTMEYYVRDERDVDGFVTTERYETSQITDKDAIRELMREAVRLSDVRAKDNDVKYTYYLSFNIGESRYISASIVGENDIMDKYADKTTLADSYSFRTGTGGYSAPGYPEITDTIVTSSYR